MDTFFLYSEVDRRWEEQSFHDHGLLVQTWGTVEGLVLGPFFLGLCVYYLDISIQFYTRVTWRRHDSCVIWFWGLISTRLCTRVYYLGISIQLYTCVCLHMCLHMCVNFYAVIHTCYLKIPTRQLCYLILASVFQLMYTCFSISIQLYTLCVLVAAFLYNYTRVLPQDSFTTAVLSGSRDFF